MVAAASSIQEQEESLDRLEQKLAEFEAQQSLMKKRLEVRKAQRMRVLAALQTLAFKPTEALIAQPLAPQDTLRSALLLREAVPQLEYSTEGLRKDLNKVASLTTAIRAQYAQIKTMTQRLDEKRRGMNVLIKKKSQLQTAFASESSRAKTRAENLAKQAGDLKELLAKLEADSKRRAAVSRETGVPTGAFMAAKGRIPYPVKGNIVKNTANRPKPALPPGELPSERARTRRSYRLTMARFYLPGLSADTASWSLSNTATVIILCWPESDDWIRPSGSLCWQANPSE